MPSTQEEPNRPLRGNGATIVHEALHREILTLTLKPGMPLDETQIARRFGLSRSPVREALHRLSAQNLVVMLPNRSTLVAFARALESESLVDRFLPPEEIFADV